MVAYGSKKISCNLNRRFWQLPDHTSHVDGWQVCRKFPARVQEQLYPGNPGSVKIVDGIAPFGAARKIDIVADQGRNLGLTNASWVICRSQSADENAATASDKTVISSNDLPGQFLMTKGPASTCREKP